MEKEYSELEVLFHQIMANMKVKCCLFYSIFSDYWDNDYIYHAHARSM